MIDFRKAGPGDLDAVMDLVNRVFGGEQGIPRELHPLPDRLRPQWWLAGQEGRVVAAAALYEEDGTWHMGRIAVAPELRGQGIATGLLDFVLRDAFSQGVPRVFLEARDATVHIMQKFGAKTAGKPLLFYGSAITLIVLEREDFFRAAGESPGEKEKRSP